MRRRAWDACDRDVHEHWKALPLHERYNWRGVLIFALIVALTAMIAWTHVAHAQDQFVGVPRIVDGDTVVINGTRIRLFGIDAPETSQYCIRNTGQHAECGKGVRDRLVEKSAGRSWTCSVVDQDRRYNRPVASCQVGGEDIQRWMVRSGLALSSLWAESTEAIQKYGTMVKSPTGYPIPLSHLRPRWMLALSLFFPQIRDIRRLAQLVDYGPEARTHAPHQAGLIRSLRRRDRGAAAG